MKKTIVLIITLVCLSLQGTFGQQKPYKSIRSFTNDKAKYLKYNFRERGEDSFQGKTFAELISSLEIQPLGASPTWKEGSEIFYLVALDLYFTCYNGTKFSPMKDELITVVFEPQIIYNNKNWSEANLVAVKGLAKYDTVFELFKAYPCNKWVPQHYEFFKNYRIKLIYYSEFH